LPALIVPVFEGMIFWEFQGGEFSQQDKVHEWDKTMDAKFEKDAKGVAREPIINGGKR
jgi:hypothetical protein